MIANPYAADLGGRDPLDALADTPGRIRALIECWTDEEFERSYAPGKWTARQVVIHLAQTELALGTRARLALSQAGYTAQAFSQDDWIALDGGCPASVALDVYTTVRRMNLELWRRLTDDERNRAFTHPEYGTLSVWWIAAQLAGHDIHHLKQLAAI
jgi:hypothetical protein